MNWKKGLETETKNTIGCIMPSSCFDFKKNILRVHDILSLDIQDEKHIIVITELLRIIEYYFPTWNRSSNSISITNKIPIIELSENIFNSFDYIWAQLVYSLVNSQMIGGLLDIPFIELKQWSIHILWINGKSIIIKKNGEVFCPNHDQLTAPIVKPATMVAIWWPSWVWKSTVIDKIRAILWDKILSWSPWYTTRPIRKNEIDGRDYHFRSIEDFYRAKKDVRFNGFIEARWNWYWNNPSIKFKQVLRSSDKLSLTSLNQTQEVMENKKIFPHLCWIWMYADEQDIKSRLKDRQDNELVKSINYNEMLLKQERSNLVDFYIENGNGTSVDTVIQKILNIISRIECS